MLNIILNKLKNLYDFSIKNWILSGILIFIPSVWFAFIIQAKGKKWSIITTDNDYTKLGIISSVIICIIWFVTTMLKTLGDSLYHAKKEKEMLLIRNDKILLSSIVHSAKEFCSNKYGCTFNYVENNSAIPAPISIFEPAEQIKKLIKELDYTLMNFLGLNDGEGEISVVVLYKKNSTDWDWFTKAQQNHGVTIDEITNRLDSSLYDIINKGENTIFHANKKNAFDKNKYIKTTKDDLYDLKGSIFCKNISIQKDNSKKYMESILCINVYGAYLCEENNIIAKGRYENIIFDLYIRMIQLELSILHIQD